MGWAVGGGAVGLCPKSRKVGGLMSQKCDLWVKLAGNGDTLRVRKVGLRRCLAEGLGRVSRFAGTYGERRGAPEEQST